jgi:twitching motility protein PilI
MADKQALHDLQTRLAERVQQAVKRTDTVQSWLAVECSGLNVLLPLEQAGEIHAFTAPTHVPHTQPWFRGVVNLRGGLFSVVDLGAYLGLSVPTVASSRDQARLVALNPRFGVNVALHVDKLSGLKRADAMSEQPSTHNVADRPGFAGRVWADAEGRVWQEVRLAELAMDEQFLGVAA